MIRGVLFDYGGVIADGGNGGQIAEKLCQTLELPLEMAQTLFLPLFKRFTRGQIDEATFWQEIEEHTNRQFSNEQRSTWDTWWGVQPYPIMLETINKLQDAHIPVGLLSNIIPPAKIKIESGGGYSHFDFTVLSCEVGYAKPDTEMYDLAMAYFDGLQSEEIVFIDDQEKCLPPAQDLGMETILATSSEQIIERLKKLDLPV